MIKGKGMYNASASDRAAVTRRQLLCGAAATGALTLGGSRAAASTVRPPNVIVILIDDMGFSDIGCYGGEIPTPNIDALAAGGLRFTQFYNNARCSCSRASLLTGAYPHQAGLGHLEAIAVPGSRGLFGKLADRVVTAAEVLRTAGYRTAMSGKWHLGLTRGVGPWQRGFDRSFTSPIGELYFPDQKQPAAKTVFIDGREVPSGSPEVGKGEWYSADLFVDWGTRFIDEARAANKPFFLYLPFVNAHFPLMAPAEDIARFRGKYAAGWDPLRRARLARQKELEIFPADAALPERLPNTYNWDKLSSDERERFQRIMEIYAANITRMDRAVGTLVARLKAAGTLDNTLILFMSDNGGNAESGPDGRTQGPGPLGGPQSSVFAGMEWATLQNTPFTEFKHYTDEGGIATPLIAHWPAGIAPRLNGSMVRAPGHLVDVMPTLLELTGAHYPARFAGNDIVPMQGRSMAPAFRGEPLHRDRPIFFEHEGNRAVRDGRWKLVAQFGKPWRLYDMDTDRTELRDLAPTQPRHVKSMAAAWDRWAAVSFVDPWSDSYDVYLKGHRRRNWGGAEVPRHPEAMDRRA